MRPRHFFLLSWAAVALVLGSSNIDVQIQRRQENSASALPTLGSGNTRSASAGASAGSTNSNTQAGNSASNTATASASQPASGSNAATASPTANANSTSSSLPTVSSSTTISSPIPTAPANSTSNAVTTDDNELPLQPHITPAFAIGGVILILTGVAYTLIGVKNRWVHIFLSTAYLTSLSITVLIVYVLNPPVSNAIQGAYFVGIFMTGIIFGAGALIFKEVTEGLGCLLGGFCLSMWFLTLKEGGLIDSTGGKAIFISVFSVVAWSLSFSHYTRPYGLMGSVAFSGATAFVLGIDCFSRGGLKEFWIYLWDLNDNIFPLNTNTYPISRGTRVETIVIILATIIGVISQIKLWKIVKDRQKQRDAMKEEENRRQEAVEAALGRHLERQNDRDRSQWEKQYGDRLNAKRETVLWTDAHGEKGFSKLKESELHGSQNSSSSESLEMANMGRKSRSMYVTRIQRQSMPVSSIAEVEEAEPMSDKAQERQKVLDQLEGNTSKDKLPTVSSSGHTPTGSPRFEAAAGSMGDHIYEATATASIAEETGERSPRLNNRNSGATDAEYQTSEKRNSDFQRHLTAPDENKKKKRRSFASYISRSRDADDFQSISPSQEALVIPETSLRHSRASSLAATLDFENENLEFPPVDLDLADSYQTPEIVVSPVGASQGAISQQAQHTIRHVPSEPELQEEHLDLDPEEFVRPTAGYIHQREEEPKISSGPSSTTKRHSGSEVGTDTLFEGTPKSKAATSDTSTGEVLTKNVLELMPSQLSHVVMSYRTNEWAKHISTADAPLVEEPEPIGGGNEVESPTHLADPQTPFESKRSSLNQSVPPQVAPPVPSTLPSSYDGIRINPILQSEQAPVSAVIQAVQPAKIRATPDTKPVPRGLRSTSTPMLVKQAMQTMPIDENVPSNFAPKQQVVRSASVQSLHQYDVSGSPIMNRPSTSTSHYPTLHRSGSRLSMVSESGVVPARSNSQLSSYQQINAYHPSPYQHNSHQLGALQRLPSKSDTRLQFYDSHQPIRRDTSLENQRREVLFADWRGQQPRSQNQVDAPEMHRQQMLMERQHIKMMEEQEKNQKWQQELAIDAKMRSRDMQDLHREAMRRMQAGANKKINT